VNPEVAGTVADMASAFEQAPAVLAALEGPQLVTAAWNVSCRRIAGPLFGSRRDSQVPELLRQVHETGRPCTASEWRIALPAEDGSLPDYCFDVTCAPWQWPDGTPRGAAWCPRWTSPRTWRRARPEAPAAARRQGIGPHREARATRPAAA
jgi:hypothetical protein